MSLRRKERFALVLEALGAGEIDVDDLARRFDVSVSTVRRDLQRLSQEKAVRRTYGGAILAKAPLELSLQQRLGVCGPAKQAIAQAAIELIKDGDTLILDAGTTVAAFGHLLRQRRLKIITNNLALLPFLAQDSGLELIVLGGAMRTTSMSTFGALAIETMRRMTADRFITSADGIVAGRGLCEADLDQVALKSLMMEQSRELIVLADSSKLGRAEQTAWAPLPAHWTLVTDKDASKDQLHSLLKSGGDVIVAG